MGEVLDQSAALGVLTRAPAAAVKALAEELLAAAPEVAVLRHRSGLLMLPMHDSVERAGFYLGEVLVCEAHVRLGGQEGYAVCLGRDMEQALAVALIDAARAAGSAPGLVEPFIAAQAAAQAAEDEALRRAVEATRVELETF